MLNIKEEFEKLKKKLNIEPNLKLKNYLISKKLVEWSFKTGWEINVLIF